MLNPNSQETVNAPPSIRRGITRLSMLSTSLAGALAGVACSSGIASMPAAAQTSMSDVDILNFALNLEYLEAEFYSVATTGQTIEQRGADISGTGNAGATTGGAMVTFTDATTAAIAKEIAGDELKHVAFLRSVLGSKAIAKPAINLNGLGTETGTQTMFLQLARAFEDTGVSAYGGAAYSIQSKTVVQAAAQILAVEAYHAGSIRTLVAQQNISTSATDSSDVLPPPSGTQYFTTIANGLAVIRTPQQVAAIVTPLFPNGINGPLP